MLMSRFNALAVVFSESSLSPGGAPADETGGRGGGGGGGGRLLTCGGWLIGLGDDPLPVTLLFADEEGGDVAGGAGLGGGGLDESFAAAGADFPRLIDDFFSVEDLPFCFVDFLSLFFGGFMSALDLIFLSADSTRLMSTDFLWGSSLPPPFEDFLSPPNFFLSRPEERIESRELCLAMLASEISPSELTSSSTVPSSPLDSL
mmetsp:Transcript_21701/g.51120  ORF Transcript_21701/g.51120 Transcript_21701/m.51120 type:complete len:203 (-) Transcript_21701:2161-2769(-)